MNGEFRGSAAAFTTTPQSFSLTNTIGQGGDSLLSSASMQSNVNTPPADYSQVMAQSTVRLAEGFINGQARLRPVTLLGRGSSDFRRIEGESMRVSEQPYIRLWTLLHQVLSHEESLADASPRSAPLWTHWAITGSSLEQQQRARLVLDAVDLDNPLSDLQLFGASRPSDVMLDRWSFRSLQYLHDMYRETRDNSGSSGGAGSPTINYVSQHLNWLARSGVSRDLTSALLNSKQHFEAPILASRDAQFGLFPCLFFLLRRGSVDEAAQCANDAARAAYARRTPSDLLDSVAYALEAYRSFFDKAKAPSADRHLSASNATATLGQNQWGSSSLHTTVHLGGSTLGASVQFDIKSLKHIDVCRKRALDQEASLLSSSVNVGGGGRLHHCPFQLAVLHMLGGDASMLTPSRDHPIYSIVLSSSSLLPAQRQQALQDGGIFSLTSRADTDELKLELSWFRLWFAATNKVSSSSMSAMAQSSSSSSQLSPFSTVSGIRSSSSASSLTPTSCSLLDVGAITIEETEIHMQSVLTASRVGSSSTSSASSSSTSFSALSAHAACERLILAGQPEYALAFLATHGNGEAGRGLHDALHMALALSWHGALRTYPVSLARKKALFSGDKEASTADVLVERMKSEAGTEIAGRNARVGKYLLYSVRSRRQHEAALSSSNHPVHVLDLPFLMEHYFSRILQPIDKSELAIKENAYVKACYAALLPHAASRVTLTSEQSLMLFPDLALELFVKPLEIVRSGPSSSRLHEAAETLYLSALLSREAGSILNAVILFRYVSILSKSTDGVIDALKIATTELSKIASISWAAATEGRLLHRGILTLPQGDLREKESLRSGLIQAITEIQQTLLHLVPQNAQGELREWQTHAQRVTSMCEFYDILASKNANQLWDSSGILLLNRLSGGLLFPNVEEVNMRSAWKVLLESLPLDLKKAYDDLLFASAMSVRIVQQTQQKTVSAKFRPFVKMLQQSKSVLDELSITLSPSTKEKLSEIDSN